MSKQGTIHLTYWREYEDSEERYDPYFKIHHTIFRNVPLSQLKRLNDKNLHKRVKAFCDKNYKETASNATGHTKVEMIHGDHYYETYADVFGKETVQGDNALFHDFGQLWNGRQFFKKDFNPDFTSQYEHKHLNKKIGGYANDN